MSDQPFDQHDSRPSTKDVAVEESKNVGNDAMEGAKSVAQTVGGEAQAMAGEAKAQVASLYQQVREDVTGQAQTQTRRAAEGLHGLAGELHQMADGATESGMATGLAQEAAQRLDGVAGWLENREPADLLDEVRGYARRNPGAFLAVCAVVGLLGGRLTRGLRDDASSVRRFDGVEPARMSAPTPTYAAVADAPPYGADPAFVDDAESAYGSGYGDGESLGDASGVDPLAMPTSGVPTAERGDRL